MEQEKPRTRDGNFKSSIIPERKKVTLMIDDVIKALFYAGLSFRKVGDCNISNMQILLKRHLMDNNLSKRG